MNKPPPHMAGHIRAVLEGAGITQVAIAELLGIDQPAISKRHRGATPWRAHELQVLSERYGIPIERFYAADEQPAEPTAAAS